MGRAGGTRIYCPNCERTQVCAAIPTSRIGLPSGQRWRRIGHDDIQWFRRGRECQECWHEFTTAELDEELVDELVELRNALAAIKKDAERYVDSAADAAEALTHLTGSLNVLRALNIYERDV